MLRIATLCAAFLALTGCATLVAPKTETLNVTSEPPGAPVTVNGNRVGVTPFALPVDHGSPLPKVQVGDIGGLHEDCRLDFKARDIYVGADTLLCITTVVGCIAFIDYANGAWNELNPNKCDVDIAALQKRADEQAAAQRVAAERQQASDAACRAPDDRRDFSLASWCAQTLAAHGDPAGSEQLWSEALRKARNRDETCAAVNAIATTSLHPEQDMVGTSPLVIQTCREQATLAASHQQAMAQCAKQCDDALNVCLNTPVQAHLLDEHTAGCYDNQRTCRAGCR